MARIFSVVGLLLCLSAGAASSDEAIAAYRAFQKRLAEVRQTLASNPNPGASYTSLAIERDSIDARFPFHPKEPAALTAERRRADVELRALTHRGKKPERTTATTKKAAPKKKAKRK